MEELLRANLIPQGIARRIQSVLLLSKGASLRRTRERTGLNLRHIVKWRERFRLGGVDALVDRPGSGRPRRVSLRQQKRILSDTLHLPRTGRQESLDQSFHGAASPSQLRYSAENLACCGPQAGAARHLPGEQRPRF